MLLPIAIPQGAPKPGTRMARGPGAGLALLLLTGLLLAPGYAQAQVVYSNDFETAAGPEWSVKDLSVTPLGARRFLGELGNDIATLTLSSLPAHTNVQVSFDLFIIRTWDGADAQDLWGLRIAGGGEIIRTTFGAFDWAWQNYPDNHPDGRYAAGTGARETNTLGFLEGATPMDYVYRVTVTIPHTSGTLGLDFYGENLEWLGNESWGLDNVQVSLNAPPTNTPPPAYTFTVFAGTSGGRGTVDGIGAQARFGDPRGLATDAQGRVVVADAWTAALRTIDSNGVVTTLAGYWSGHNDGLGSAGSFGGCTSIATDPDGNLYVADGDAHCIRRVTPGGYVTTIAGRPWNSGAQDGAATNSLFNVPRAIARDPAGNLYVADLNNHLVRKLDTNGIVSTLAGAAGLAGSVDGTGAAARFWEPAGVAADANGNVFVAERENHAIRKVTPEGVVTTYAGALRQAGTSDGYRLEARFNYPDGLAIDRFGALYVADRRNQTIRKISPDGSVTTLAGVKELRGFADGSGAGAGFWEPQGVAVDRAGNVFVSDSYNLTVRKITSAGAVTTLAGSAPAWGSTDGPRLSARFRLPTAVAFDTATNLYVADAENHVIRKVTPAGLVTTLAGLAGWGDFREGQGSEARFNQPWGVAADVAGNVYVGDRYNQVIRKVAPDGTVTTLAGAPGQGGGADGVGSDARFWEPMGVALDGAGNVYVADRNNHAIRKVTAAGVVSTLAGALGQSGNSDGAGAAARFTNPEGLAVDAQGNVYVADTANLAIRKIATNGVVSTLIGNSAPYGGVDGPASQVRLDFQPSGVALDATGNLFISGDGRIIRKLSPDGMLTTIAGRQGWDMAREGTAADARFMWPRGLAVDPRGGLVVSDSSANCLWRGVPTTCLDRPVLDQRDGWVGETRQLRAALATGSAWHWSLVRRPTTSCAELVGATTATPTFTPDVPDTYVFQLAATDPAGNASIRTLEFTASASGEFHFALAQTNVSEGIGTLSLRVDRSGDTNSEVSVDYYTLNGTARGGGDFAYTTGTLIFTNGQLSAWANVPIIDDPAVEGLETFQVGLSNAPAGWSTLYPCPVTVGILDNEHLRPAIAELSPSQWVAAGDFVELTVRANGAGPLTYQWLLNGAPVPGATNATLRLHALTPGIGGGYSVVVSNPFGSRTSSVLALNVTQASKEYTWTILGGTRGGSGFVDGQGAEARFDSPWAVATDSAGNIYVGDPGALRKISPSGAVSTLAGRVERGWVEGLGGNAQFNWIAGLTVDPDGFVYVAESDDQIIRRVSPDGSTSTLAGHPGWSGSDDGSGDAARFLWPHALTRDTNGNLFVADEGNQTIRKITLAGAVTTLAGSPGQAGATNGTGSAARFHTPRGVVADKAGNLFVADADNHCIRKVTSAGVVTTYAGAFEQAGFADGPLLTARFSQPTGIAIDAAGNLYIAERWNHDIRKVGTNGLVTTLAGSPGQSGYTDGTGGDARFWEPTGVAVDAAGNVIVSDWLNHTIRKITPDGVVTTVAGAPSVWGTNDGVVASARFSSPRAIAADLWGNVYVGEAWNTTLRRISPEGLVSIVAGQPYWGGGEDGLGGDARFSDIWGLACDWEGNIFVGDRGNHTIRKVTPEGLVTTLAGQAGQNGAQDGVGDAARFNEPFGVGVDLSGNVFVADHSNHAIRKVAPDGTVTTLAGRLGVWGAADGVGTNALFRYPEGLAVDSAGNVFVADRENQAIRKITPAGVVTTVVGHLAWGGFQLGRGEDSWIDNPTGVAFDAVGNLYIASENARVVLKLDLSGGLSLVGGKPGWAYAMEGTGKDALLEAPYAVAADPAGVLYVADADHRIWRGEPNSCPDWMRLDAVTGPVGEPRQLSTSPQTATSWGWSLIRRPATSSAAIVGGDTLAPTFTPDMPDRYIFRLTVTNDWGWMAIRTMELAATNLGAFTWALASTNLPESTGVLAVSVLRTGDLSRPASVSFATRDGTAHAGTNYLAASNVVAFAAGQGTNFAVLTVLNNPATEGTRDFTVQLSQPSAGWSALFPSRLTVEVSDADAAAPVILPGTAAYSSTEGFSFLVGGLSNRVYRLWASTNLADWVPVQTVTNAGSVFPMRDAGTAWPQRFYRVELRP